MRESRYRVHKIGLIGSRARGDARPDSDLDLVVIVEQPAGEIAWDTVKTKAEKAELIRLLQGTPFPIDLFVRTAAQYFEGRTVIGGAESLLDFEGVMVFEQPLTLPPRKRRRPVEVARLYVQSWFEIASASLFAAFGSRMERAAALFLNEVGPGAAAAARDSVHGSVNVPFVMHQVRVSKHDSMEAKLGRLRTLDPGYASWLEHVTAPGISHPKVAHAVLAGTLRWATTRDPALAAPLRDLSDKLNAPLLSLSTP